MPCKIELYTKLNDIVSKIIGSFLNDWHKAVRVKKRDQAEIMALMRDFNVSCNFSWEIWYRENSWRQLFLREIIFKTNCKTIFGQLGYKIRVSDVTKVASKKSSFIYYLYR